MDSFRPLADAQLGEWCELRARDGRTLHYEVTYVGITTVKLRVTATQDGKPIGLPVEREESRELDEASRWSRRPQVNRRLVREPLEIAGRSWNARLYEDRWVDEDIHYVRRTWVSEQSPVLGLLRMELRADDAVEASLELARFGMSADRSTRHPAERSDRPR